MGMANKIIKKLGVNMIELIPDWKVSWRWLSMNLMALAASLQVGYLTLPDEMKASISPDIIQIITAFLLAAGMVGRVIKQPAKAVEKENDNLGT